MPYVEKHSEKEEKKNTHDISLKMFLGMVVLTIVGMFGWLVFVNYGTMYGLRENAFNLIAILLLVVGVLLFMFKK